ncbi:MAG: pirin family protein [Pseudomonadota bacterium]
MTKRSVRQVLQGRPTSDGGGVRLTRLISPEQGLDPFLLLDEFDSDAADDYLAGFPAHPHRGFETVTYMLDGHMLHEDHLGNRGELKPGGVQWMTAGRGIVHSEMPQQVAGRMRGFQLWINLPAVDKMKPAAYQDLEPELIPRVAVSGGEVGVVAGQFVAADGGIVAGPISGGATQPLYLDVALAAGAALEVATPPGHTVLAYVFEGEVTMGGRTLTKGTLALLNEGDTLVLLGTECATRVLVIGGRPLGEPVVHYGPFVMNTADEIRQAVRDFQSGRLTA